MEHFLLPDTVYTLVKAWPFDMASNVYETSVTLSVNGSFWFFVVILNTQSAF